jgi:hypothetical protein
MSFVVTGILAMTKLPEMVVIRAIGCFAITLEPLGVTRSYPLEPARKMF